MGIEKLDNCVLETDERGVPLRPTNMEDVRRADQMPPPLKHVNAPPGYTHAAPDILNPYQTGKRSLPPQGDKEP
jgi:hypothetical protein